MATFILRSLWVPLLGSGTLSLFLVACGEQDQDRKTCEYDGSTYQDGETIPGDCAACTCDGGQVLCPAIGCVEEQCSLPWDAGSCEADVPRFWHNPESGVCEAVSYGGCDGNENNFATIEECQTTCDAQGGSGSCESAGMTYEDGESFPAEDGCNTCTCDDGTASCTEIGCEAELCELPFESGPCDAAIPRFWYNAETEACEEVSYGGCDGNENNFETLDACESACVSGCIEGEACEVVSCQVGDVVYDDGDTGIPDPTSCNTCTCEAGELVGCTEISCPEDCPEGRMLGQDCTSCGPTDACLVQRTGCLLECDVAEDCADEGGLCLDGLCRNVCG